MKRTYLVFIITMLVIGFAAVTTNLVINGTINFGFNQDDFNNGVIFTHTNTYNGEASISENKKLITFNTIKLENVNQQSILDFYVTNKSLQYDANITINCGLETTSESYKQYIKIEQDLQSPFNLESGETKKGRLTITLIKAYNDGLEKEISMVCKIEATPKERDTKGTYTPVVPQYEEIFLKGTDPVLEGNEAIATSNKKLIPVKISENGKITRADTTKEWYNYENKNWANAVILNDGEEDPGPEKEILESQIESYFVWIPKYRYKLWNIDGTNNVDPFAIEVEFGTTNTSDSIDGECKTPISDDGTQALSGGFGQCENGMWMTHPAFITMGVKGFWVGKFEVGYKDAKSETDAEVDKQDSNMVIVKPDVYSWRSIATKNMFNSLKNYATNLDSHMMKNTEWGAVAYLSHSEYGINDELQENSNSEYKTGYAKTDSGMVAYPSQEGFNASTTGNITGIYDMSGGAWERMAAYRDIATLTEQIGKSEFTKQQIQNNSKYFDVYDKESTQTSYNKHILGDATGEMGPFSNKSGSWYEDFADFVESATSWFGRGGYPNNGLGTAGLFGFGRTNGGAVVYYGSRLVLSPQ